MLVVLCVLLQAVAALASTGAMASEADVARWIAELDSGHYSVRESATASLVEAGIPAFDSLLVAANGDRAEVTERAVWILEQAATYVPPEGETKGPDWKLVQKEALLRLSELETKPAIKAAAVARLALIEHYLAIGEIARLGGRYREKGIDEKLGMTLDTRIELDENWKGGDSGLEQVAKVLDARLVKLVRAPVTAAAIEKLGSMKSLQEIQLYAMDVSDAELTGLKAALPGISIDRRRGALLGVSGERIGSSKVSHVTPGSAAAVAGIIKDDVVTKINDTSVNTFQELTAEVSRYQAGDEVTIELKRGSRTLTKQVTFGGF